MNPDKTVIWVGALLIWQFYSSVLVGMSKYIDAEGKVRLIAIIWALPLLGTFYARFALNQAARDAAERRAKAARAAAASPPAKP